MADREYKRPWHAQTGVVQFDGYVALDGRNASVLTTTDLPDVTVIKSTTGVYLLTFADKFLKVLSASASYTCTAASTGLSCEVGGFTSGNPTTVTVRTVNAAGAPTDASTACGFTVHIVVKNSSVR